jgi:outer membrane protein OmpA-like peptidoglycan-associated protein
MIFRSPLILTTAALLGLTACVPAPFDPADPNANARQGAIIGGLGGAITGALADDNEARGAVVGGILGAAAGGVIGSTLDQQARELSGAIGNPNISVTNQGDYLIVNMPQDVLFATDSATLRPDLTSDISAVGANLVRYPDSRIEVIGHTDNTGTAAYNQDLSQRRASSVAGILAQSGVASSRLAIIGAGEDRPIASNLTPEGRAQNRRVEIIIRPTR